MSAAPAGIAEAAHWPLAAVEVTASAPGARGCPVEVAVAIWDRPEADAMTLHSSLVRPTPVWRTRGDWDELRHGPAFAELAEAPSAADVARGFAELTRGLALISSDPAMTGLLVDRLIEETEAARGFTILHVDALQRLAGATMALHTARSGTANRAGPAAAGLIRGLAASIGRNPRVTEVALAAGGIHTQPGAAEADPRGQETRHGHIPTA